MINTDGERKPNHDVNCNYPNYPFNFSIDQRIKDNGTLKKDSISELKFVKKMKEDIKILYRIAEHDDRHMSYKAMTIINSFRIQYLMEEQKAWKSLQTSIDSVDNVSDSSKMKPLREYNPHIYEFDSSLSLKNFVLISQPIKFEEHV